MMIEFRSGKCIYTQCVAGIVRRSGYVLLQRAPGGFILPGGRVEWLEHSRSALSRELWDELCVRASIGRLLWLVENLFDHRGCHVHQVLIIYETTLAEEISVEHMQASRMCWRPIEEVNRLPLFPEFLRNGLCCLPASVEHVCVA